MSICLNLLDVTIFNLYLIYVTSTSTCNRAENGWKWTPSGWCSARSAGPGMDKIYWTNGRGHINRPLLKWYGNKCPTIHEMFHEQVIQTVMFHRNCDLYALLCHSVKLRRNTSKYHMSNRQNSPKTKVVGSGLGMFKFVWKPWQQTDRGPPTYQYPIFTHSLEAQTFTTDRGPPTLGMSIASSK